MQLISKTEDNEKTIKFTVDEYEHLLKILDLCTPPEHRNYLFKVMAEMFNDLYDMDLL